MSSIDGRTTNIHSFFESAIDSPRTSAPNSPSTPKTPNPSGFMSFSSLAPSSDRSSGSAHKLGTEILFPKGLRTPDSSSPKTPRGILTPISHKPNLPPLPETPNSPDIEIHLASVSLEDPHPSTDVPAQRRLEFGSISVKPSSSQPAFPSISDSFLSSSSTASRKRKPIRAEGEENRNKQNISEETDLQNAKKTDNPDSSMSSSFAFSSESEMKGNVQSVSSAIFKKREHFPAEMNRRDAVAARILERRKTKLANLSLKDRFSSLRSLTDAQSKCK